MVVAAGSALLVAWSVLVFDDGPVCLITAGMSLFGLSCSQNCTRPHGLASGLSLLEGWEIVAGYVPVCGHSHHTCEAASLTFLNT